MQEGEGGNCFVGEGGVFAPIPTIATNSPAGADRLHIHSQIVTFGGCSPPLSPALKHRGPLDSRDYVVTRPTCWPLLILSPALRHRGSPRRQSVM